MRTTEVQRREFDIPGFPALRLHLYGNDVARTATESRAQGYFVTKHKVATPRADLLIVERNAVSSFLCINHPEHAQI